MNTLEYEKNKSSGKKNVKKADLISIEEEHKLLTTQKLSFEEPLNLIKGLEKEEKKEIKSAYTELNSNLDDQNVDKDL